MLFFVMLQEKEYVIHERTINSEAQTPLLLLNNLNFVRLCDLNILAFSFNICKCRLHIMVCVTVARTGTTV